MSVYPCLKRPQRAAQGCPPVDLLLRTSGEARLSDFLLWQAGGAQLAFARALWPELSFADLLRALVAFQRAAPRLAALRAAAAAEAGIEFGAGSGATASAVPAGGASVRREDGMSCAAARKPHEAAVQTPGVDCGPAGAACGETQHVGAAPAPLALASAGPRHCGNAAAFVSLSGTHASTAEQVAAAPCAVAARACAAHQRAEPCGPDFQSGDDQQCAARRQSVGELAGSASMIAAHAPAHTPRAVGLRAAEPCSRPVGHDGMGGSLGGSADEAWRESAQLSMQPAGLAGAGGEGVVSWWDLARAAEAPALLRRRSCGRLEAAPTAAITAQF